MRLGIVGPIVFAGGTDPVRSGLVTNLHHPGGNITGVSAFQIELEPKNLELLWELRPKAAMIAVLINPNFPDAEQRNCRSLDRRSVVSCPMVSSRFAGIPALLVLIEEAGCLSR